MRLLHLLLLLLVTQTSFGQLSYTVSGRLLDAQSEEPLVYASVRVKGRNISTISNSQGRFDFYVSGRSLNDTIVISMLGYMNYTAIVSSLVKEPGIEIKMNRDVIFLEEVVIADSLGPGDIVRIAMNKIELNYPMEPYSMEGFYRDIKSVDGEYVSLLEAAVNIFDKGYKKPLNPKRLKERVGLIAIRKSMGYDRITERWFDKSNLLEGLLLKNYVKYRTFPRRDSFFDTLIFNGYTSYNGRLVYVIEYNDDFSLQLFIDAENYSIIRIQYEVGNGKEPVEVERKNRRKHNYILRVRSVLDFQGYGDRVYLHYLNTVTETKWINPKSERALATTRLFQELLINNVSTNDPEMVSSNLKMKRFGLQYQDIPYDRTFWETYNVIKDSPLEEAVVQDLEKKESLEQQFEKN